MAYYMANEIEKSNQAFLIYQDDNGITQVNVRFEGDDVWLPVELIMELFDASQQDVSYHIGQIYASGELSKDRTHKKILLVRQEGNRSVNRQISHYNLDMIIAVGFRVQSQVTDIFITSIDYAPTANLTKQFFATVQNKLHYAAHQHTAAELIYDRVDADKPMVGMTNFKGSYITKEDVQVAKNYLTEQELTYLNLLVSQYLDFAEVQALQQIPMRMAEWIEKLDELMRLSGRQLLVGKGTISHEEAKQKAIAAMAACTPGDKDTTKASVAPSGAFHGVLFTKGYCCCSIRPTAPQAFTRP